MGTSTSRNPTLQKPLDWAYVADNLQPVVDVEDLLADLEEVPVGCQRPEVDDVGAEADAVVGDPVELGHDDADELRPPRDLDAGQPLDDEDRDRIAEVLSRACGPAGDPFTIEREPEGRHASIMWTDLNSRRD